ncbi:Retrovirus-related Pol polyprotein from transposon TNT 1-94 [Araneus ventricosus]|uniref:Retrovirus-related Pol polyprotein from transposon TNT 1-94 n=1 Tax=Araneus ventricosus TaxID=182803 RepID=A0A4Y2KYU7_ARAVE|nr:Retrovirus-related Pol polyprotein from transposon TNT 1-94 [Araneus ventricosus]
MKTNYAITTKALLERVYMDIWSPSPVKSLGGNLYFLSIIDGFSRKIDVYIIKRKSEVLECFKKYLYRSERELNVKLKCVQTDNGLEFCSNAFEQLVSGLGIKMERTSVYTPEQNGVAERFNRTAVEGIRSMLQDSGLKPQFWVEVLLAFVHVKNRCVHKLTGNKTPIEICPGYHPSVRYFRIFGSLAHVYIPSVRRNKLQPKADVGIMIGYGIKTRGYRLWVPTQRRVIETTHVSINEHKNGVKHLYGTPHTYESVDVLNSSENLLDIISENMQEFEESGEKCKIMKEQEIKPINISSWKRVERPRTKSSRVHIYYYPPSGKPRLRSLNDVKKYCDKENLKFEPDMFLLNLLIWINITILELKIRMIALMNHYLTTKQTFFQEEIYNLVLPKSSEDTRKSPESKLWEETMKSELKVMHDRNVWT